ncbi:MAG: ABC transporter permease [Candidatus Cryosericum sp.]
MKGVLGLCVQDFKRLLNNALFWVVTATLVGVILIVNFALPESMSGGSSYELVSYGTARYGASARAVGSQKELRRLVTEDGAVGLVGTPDGSVTVVHQGLSEKSLTAIMLQLSVVPSVPVEVETLREGSRIIPFNKRMTPAFICFEALMVGFILGGALMLSEKEEGTIRALRIAPLGADKYLMSKTLLFSAIGTLYALFMAVFCIGLQFAWGRFILLSFFGSALFCLIGLAFTTLFRDMSSWFFSMALLLSVNMLPIISYSAPSFSPAWMKLIPSYSMLFAYERILFGTGGISLSAALGVALWCLGAYMLSRTAVTRLLRAGRGG